MMWKPRTRDSLKKEKAMDDRESKTNKSVGEGGEAAGTAKAMAEDNAMEDAEVKKLSADLDELKNTLMRHQADFANYRKRMEKEQTEASSRATARVVEKLIPIVDSFEHALAAHREAEYENYRKGFELIYKQLIENLTKLGAERLEPLGRMFDPHLHQAVDREETVHHPDGEILAVFQPGYEFQGRVLRPAMVRVAVHPGPASKVN
jgi:molecular chaperone GrpE